MLRFLRFLLVWLASSVTCLVGVIPVSALGVTVPGLIAFPLAMGLGGIFAAVAAKSVGDLLVFDRTRARLLPVAGITEVAAAIVSAGLIAAFIMAGGVVTGILSPLIYPILVCTGLITLSATVAAGLLRTTEGSAWRDFWMALGLIAFGMLVVVAVPLVLCSTVVICLPY